MSVRRVEKCVLSVEQSEGVGARVRRSIGRREVSWQRCCCCCCCCDCSSSFSFPSYFSSSSSACCCCSSFTSSSTSSSSLFLPLLTSPLLEHFFYFHKLHPCNVLYMFCFQLTNLDPFLMLDEFKVSKPAGFPDHPHRGFETVSVWLTFKKSVMCLGCFKLMCF